MQIKTKAPRLKYTAAETFRLPFNILSVLLPPVMLQHHPVRNTRNCLPFVVTGLT